MSDNGVYIVSAVRTPIGSFIGQFASTPAHELGSVVIREAVARARVAPGDVSEVIMGQALTAGQGQNPARNASISAGLPVSVPAHGVSMLCGSGLKAVASGYQAIRCGDAAVVVVGGQESMTRAPHAALLRTGIKAGEVGLKDTMMHDGLTDVFHDIHMGITVENLCAKCGVTREQSDGEVVESQARVQRAIKAGFFAAEIVPVPVKGRDGQVTLVADDEFPQKNTTLEGLSKLQPRFKPGGTVTAGNASGINDGAAALVLMSGAEVARRKATVLARIVAHATAGCEPDLMAYGPVPAVEALLKKTGWSRDDVDLWELNEAYGGSTVAVNQCLKLDDAKVNVLGGAVALGHPIGASGARVLVTLVHALTRTGGKRGICSLCIGGGMGIAMAVECV